ALVTAFASSRHTSRITARHSIGHTAREIVHMLRLRLLRLPELFEDRLEGVDDVLTARPRLRETELQIERLGRRSIRKDEVLGPSGLGLRCGLPHLLTRHATLAGHPFDQRRHFL